MLLPHIALVLFKLLQRVLHMQLDAFGPDDVRCTMTRSKITILEREESPSFDESSTYLPILETSQESGDSPNTSMSNTLKVWRERNAISKDAYFL